MISDPSHAGAETPVWAWSCQTFKLYESNAFTSTQTVNDLASSTVLLLHYGYWILANMWQTENVHYRLLSHSPISAGVIYQSQILIWVWSKFCTLEMRLHKNGWDCIKVSTCEHKKNHKKNHKKTKKNQKRTFIIVVKLMWHLFLVCFISHHRKACQN